MGFLNFLPEKPQSEGLNILIILLSNPNLFRLSSLDSSSLKIRISLTFLESIVWRHFRSLSLRLKVKITRVINSILQIGVFQEENSENPFI